MTSRSHGWACGHHLLEADLWRLISPQHFDDMPTNRPSGFPDTGAFIETDLSLATRPQSVSLPGGPFPLDRSQEKGADNARRAGSWPEIFIDI